MACLVAVFGFLILLVFAFSFNYRTRVRSLLAMLVTDTDKSSVTRQGPHLQVGWGTRLSVTDWLTHSCLVNLMWPWRGKMLRLLLLLMLVMRIVLATVCSRFGSWGSVIKHNFCLDFEHKIWSRFWSRNSGEIWNWSWCLVEVTQLDLGHDSEARFGQDFKFKHQNHRLCSS